MINMTIANILQTVKTICMREAHFTLAQFTNRITPARTSKQFINEAEYLLLHNAFVGETSTVLVREILAVLPEEFPIPDSLTQKDTTLLLPPSYRDKITLWLSFVFKGTTFSVKTSFFWRKRMQTPKTCLYTSGNTTYNKQCPLKSKCTIQNFARFATERATNLNTGVPDNNGT